MEAVQRRLTVPSPRVGERNTSIDWTIKEGVQARLRVMVRRILTKYGYLPDHQESAVALVLEQAKTLSEGWSEEEADVDRCRRIRPVLPDPFPRQG